VPIAREDSRRASLAVRLAAVVAIPAVLVGGRVLAGDLVPADLAWAVDLTAFGLSLGLGVQCLALLIGLQRATDRGMRDLAAGIGDLRDQMEAQRRLAAAAVEQPAQAPAAGGDNATMDKVASELRVLQALVSDLSGRGQAQAQASADERSRRAAAPVQASAQGRAAAVQDLRRTAPGPRDEGELLSMVRSGLREGRVDVYVQPIVSLPQRKHRFYECFSRIRDTDGSVVGPDRYLAGAEREGLIGAIDNMLLFRSVQLVRRIHRANRETGIFVNISEHSLADKRFFRDFAAFVAENKELSPYLIFEFAQAHVARHGAAVMLELERLARRGFRFSMDQVTDLSLDTDALAERQFRFIKVDAQRLLQAVHDPASPLDLRRFKASLDRNGIDLVVERIENEDTLRELLDYPIDFGQGYLFGEPRIAKTAA
jgi:cyclic-di-GMP phosphodiesterase, flagellum assembly factor TipF